MINDYQIYKKNRSNGVWALALKHDDSCRRRRPHISVGLNSISSLFYSFIHSIIPTTCCD